MNIIEVFKLFGSILVDSSEAEKSLSKTDKKTKSLGDRLGGGIKTAAKWGAGIAVAAGVAGAAAFAMVNKVTQGFDDISKGAQRAGVTTDFYQEMDFWASQNGLSHENMEKAVGRLNQRIGMASDGNEKYATALETLGVNMEDVRNGTVSTEEVMAQSIQSLSEMENGNEQAALAAELFGTKLGRELLPALQDGALSMEDAKKKAEELGIVIGEDSLAAGVKFQDTWDGLKRSFSAVTAKIGAELIPIFQKLMDWVIENMPMIQETIETVFDVIESIFTTFSETIQTVIGWFQALFESNETTFNGMWETIKEYIGFVVEYWTTIWEWIVTFFREHGQTLMDDAKEIFNSIWGTVETIFNAVKDIITQIIGYIVPWVQEKLKVLQDFWKQNGEQIMQAVDNAFSFIQGVIEFVMPIIQAIIKGAWEIIQTVFDTVIGVIMGLVKTFSSMLTGDFEGIKEGITKIWDSLWEGIKGVVEGAWNLLSGAFGALWDSISGWFGDLKDKAFDWGSNMIDGFIDGMKSMGQAVANAAGDVVKEAGNFLKFWSPAKKGEGRFIRNWGANMIDGFLDGVRDEEDNAGIAMHNVVKTMQPGNLGLNVMNNAGQGVMQSTSNIGVGNVETLLNELIRAVRENKDVYISREKVTDAVNGTNAVADVGRYF